MVDLYSMCKALDLIINTLKTYSKNMSNDPLYRKFYIRQMIKIYSERKTSSWLLEEDGQTDWKTA